MLGSSMVDRATPNLPSRHFDATIAFYSALGFTVGFRDSGWLILDRGHLVLEFFPYEGLNPATSSFGSCLRLDDLDAFYNECLKAGIPQTTVGWPRVEPPTLEASGPVSYTHLDVYKRQGPARPRCLRTGSSTSSA